MIGQWVRRPTTKWHFVESIVADDAITHCGRRLRNEGEPLEWSEVKPLTRMIGQPQNCQICDPAGTLP